MRSVRSSGKEKLSKYYKPMLATLGDEPFDNDNWIFEIKWDGYRAIAELDGSNIKLYSRNGLSFLSLYPAVAEALKKLDKRAVLDGEIVFINDQGKPDFQKLQQYGDVRKGRLLYYVFDCLAVGGKSITNLSVVERKQILKELIGNNSVVKYADHVVRDGVQFFNSAAGLDLEGIIAKRADSKYFVGKRTSDWLKIKHHNIQEAIIAGFTAPRGSREYFGALILAIQENNRLKYIGHTGTGFTQTLLHDLHKRLAPLITSTSPFPSKVPVNTKVTWVQPQLVCNVKFTEITQGGILRHPVFMGLRIDKEAKDADHLEKPIKRKLATSRKAKQ